MTYFNRTRFCVTFSIPILWVFVLLCPALQAGGVYSRQEGSLWIAGNDGMEIAIDRQAGVVRRLVDRVSKEDYCNQLVKNVGPLPEFQVGARIAGLILFDELNKKEFSDLTGNGAVRNFRQSKTPEFVAVSFQKLFPGAEFVVVETFTVTGDHVRWDVRLKKTTGKDRTVRVIQFAPLPLAHYRGWAPISDPLPMKPYTPWAVEYGQSTYGAVGEQQWRTNIPMVVFYSPQNKRAIAFTSAFEVPAVRIRFLNNTSALADFHWNSRHYPLRERPYLQVSNEYLGLRTSRDIQTSLLISAHPSDWRPALGWVYEKYRKYFDPDPNFDQWDGVFVSGGMLLKDSLTDEERRNILEARRARGARWEEQHGHFPWYGLMIPKPDVKSWVCESHPQPGITLTRKKIREHQAMNKEYGIGTFIYYNCTEAEYWYAKDQFPESIARDEDGKEIGAYQAQTFPSKRACWLMNADLSTPFGKHMAQQARDLVAAYPDIAGFFWDVYGRSYMFDFAHDDGITMVNNKPAYYPAFMYERMMRQVIGPLLHKRGMCITANKPTVITACEGLDGIMVIENTPEEETPSWIAAQSYLGLNRHVMILDGQSGTHAELFFQDCLRYGMFYSDLSTNETWGRKYDPSLIAKNRQIEKVYAPFIQRLRGKKWVFYPEALTLPENTDGNIFRLKDGSVMITVSSAWRILRKAEGFDRNLKITCRLPDADKLVNVYAASLDLGETVKLNPERSGDTLYITVPKHGRTTVVILSPAPDQALETKLTSRQ